MINLKQKTKIPRWIFLSQVIAIATIYFTYTNYAANQNTDFLIFTWLVLGLINLILLFWRNK